MLKDLRLKSKMTINLLRLATAEDDSAGTRWINTDLLGSTEKMKNPYI